MTFAGSSVITLKSCDDLADAAQALVEDKLNAAFTVGDACTIKPADEQDLADIQKALGRDIEFTTSKSAAGQDGSCQGGSRERGRTNLNERRPSTFGNVVGNANNQTTRETIQQVESTLVQELFNKIFPNKNTP
jgi:hypothetical protein